MQIEQKKTIAIVLVSALVLNMLALAFGYYGPMPFWIILGILGAVSYPFWKKT